MISDNNDPNDTQLTDLLRNIAEDARNVGSSDDIDSLKDKIDSLVLLAEEFGRARELQNSLSEYVQDLKNEVSDIRNYRFWVTSIFVVMSVMLFAILIACMVAKPIWFMELDGALQVPLIISLGGGSIFLMSLVLRGVYRSRHERNHGEMLPEAVRVALDSFKSD